MCNIMPGSRRLLAAGLILAAGVICTEAADKEDSCGELWTIAGQGREAPWLRTNGYRIGMKKVQAHQIRRAGLITSIAKDEWNYILPGAYIVLEFEKGTLVSGRLIVEGRDYNEALKDLIAVLQLPEDFGADYALWRSEECDTVKILKADGDNVAIVIQSIDFFSRKTVKKEKR